MANNGSADAPGGQDVHREWEPLPLSNALMGHLMIDAIGALLSFALLYAAQLTQLTTYASFGVLAGGAICGWLLMSVTGTLLERRFVLVKQHDDPGSWTKTGLLILIAVIAGVFAGFIIGAGDTRWLFVATTASLIGYGIEFGAFVQPWRDGMTRSDVRTAWDQTKTMTSELFSEEIKAAERRPGNGGKRADDG